MDFNLSQYLIYGVPVITLVIGLVKLLQQQGLPSKYAPITSLTIGILGGIGVAVTNGQTILYGIVLGILFGLSASGIYDIGKKTT